VFLPSLKAPGCLLPVEVEHFLMIKDADDSIDVVVTITHYDHRATADHTLDIRMRVGS
jgi:hypothetical protein